jgi:acetyl esterase/lipase
MYDGARSWWSGNEGIRDTKYTIWGPLVGTCGFLIHFWILRKKEKIVLNPQQLKILLRAQWGMITASLILIGMLLPFFVLPAQTSVNAQNEFTKTWGVNWESKISTPSHGPWLKTPFSVSLQYGQLPYSKNDFTFTQNITFLTNANDSFLCDAWIPKGDGPFPMLLEIHGGGWCGGDKEYLDYQKEYFAAAGYSVFSVQYGAKSESGDYPGIDVYGNLRPLKSRQYSMQEIMNNLASFSDWIAQPTQYTTYKVNISQCFCVGLSAGGHLSALLGTARFNVSNWNPSVVLKGAIDFYGIPDLRHWDVLSPEWFKTTGLMNASVLTDYSLVDKFSPMTYVEYPKTSGSTIVPLLVFHGDMDGVVPITQSQEFNAMCDSRGYKCDYIEIPKADHVFEGDARSGPTQISLWAMERFMKLCSTR